MIFLRRRNDFSRGQTLTEYVCALLLLQILFFAGTLLMLKGLGTLLLTHFASVNSHCIARKQNLKTCESEVRRNLGHTLIFKNIDVRVTRPRGVIHSEILAHWAMQKVRGVYDLEPSEYRRVQ